MKYGYEIKLRFNDKTTLCLYGDGIEEANIVGRFGDMVSEMSMIYRSPTKYLDIHSGEEYIVDGGQLDSIELHGTEDVLKKIIDELWGDDCDRI